MVMRPGLPTEMMDGVPECWHNTAGWLSSLVGCGWLVLERDPAKRGES